MVRARPVTLACIVALLALAPSSALRAQGALPDPAAAAPAAAPATYELTFHFEQNGNAGTHQYVLKWATPDSNLQTIDVVIAESHTLIQTIPVPQDRVHLIYQDLVGADSKGHTIRDRFFDCFDYNFDKYGDLRLATTWPAKIGQKSYLIWLFDPSKSQYVLNEALSALPHPVPNPKMQLVDSTELGGFSGGEYVKKGFSVEGDGHLVIRSRVSQTLVDPTHLIYQREVRLRVAGVLQRVCKIRVPTEGKPRLLWGKKETCRDYLEKET